MPSLLWTAMLLESGDHDGSASFASAPVEHATSGWPAAAQSACSRPRRRTRSRCRRRRRTSWRAACRRVRARRRRGRRSRPGCRSRRTGCPTWTAAWPCARSSRVEGRALDRAARRGDGARVGRVGIGELGAVGESDRSTGRGANVPPSALRAAFVLIECSGRPSRAIRRIGPRARPRPPRRSGVRGGRACLAACRRRRHAASGNP
jgi:hypothetical protein